MYLVNSTTNYLYLYILTLQATDVDPSLTTVAAIGSPKKSPSVPGMTDEEKKKLRAERFGVPDEQTDVRWIN